MMNGIDLQMLAAANDAVLQGDNAMVSGVCIDSRLVVDGDVFVAIKGEQVDGHQYLGKAAEQGAVGAVVEIAQDIELPQIVVADTQRALGLIAKVNRDAYNGKVVAITGSAGKTTCKNMLAAILSQVGNVCATRGNFNNELGLPLTLQRIKDSDDYAVLEMGAAKAGDIDYLVQIGQPHISAITNVNEAHVGGFGSIEVTAKTKGEIYGALPAGGVAIINRDDAFANDWRRAIEMRDRSIHIVDCSLTDPKATIFASDIQQSATGLTFNANINPVFEPDAVETATNDTNAIKVSIGFLGEHNIQNALMAIGIAKALGVSENSIVTGLADAKPEPGRLCPLAGLNNLLVLDDSYNANPKAAQAAIDAFIALAASSGASAKRIAALGDMGELGDAAEQLHYQVGEYAASQGVTHLYAVGEFADAYIAGYCHKKGVDVNSSSSTAHFNCQQDLTEQLLSDDCMGAAVLVKGSRSAKMDRVVVAITAQPDLKGTASTSPAVKEQK